jgi:superoxide dismutase, Fe-Mn family
MEMSRREVMTALAAGSAAMMSLGGIAEADDKGGPATKGAAAAPGKHVPVALPFDPTKRQGISEKLIRSHHDNN